MDNAICGALSSGQQVDYVHLEKDGNVIMQRQ